MFGPDLLVCPVTEAGVTSRTVYLPPLPAGKEWQALAVAGTSSAQGSLNFTGTKYKGGQTITAAAPLELMPVFKIS